MNSIDLEQYNLSQPLKGLPADSSRSSSWPLKICRSLFDNPIIRASGSVTVCNFDLGGELELGNINSAELYDLWNKGQINQLRNQHIFTPSQLPLICQKCRPDYYLSEFQLYDFLVKSNQKQRLPGLLNKHQIKLRVVLINPHPSANSIYRSTCSLGLGYIALALSRIPEVEVLIIDMCYSRISNQELIDWLKLSPPHIIGLTAMTYQANNARQTALELKRQFPHCLFWAGGVIATASPEFFLKDQLFDSVFLNEADCSVVEMIDYLRSDLKTKFPAGVIASPNVFNNLDLPADLTVPDPVEFEKIPSLDRRLMPNRGIIEDSVFKESAALLMFSRGCPGNCIFCASPMMSRRRVRYRLVADMVNEIQQIIVSFGIRNFIIDDDCFTADSSRVEEFCQELLLRRLNISFRINAMIKTMNLNTLKLLKSAGCVKVTYGVESVNSRIMRILRKPFRVEKLTEILDCHQEISLPAALLFIIGSPEETLDTVAENLDFIRQNNPAGGWDFQIMQPHPGTTMADLAPRAGTLLTRNWDHYFSDNITFVPRSFTTEEFFRLCSQVTGRNITLAGIHQPVASESPISAGEFVRIQIKPENWHRSWWDLTGPCFWEGDQSSSGGLAHALGRNQGFFEYKLAIPQKLNWKPQFGRLTFRACSQLIGQNSGITISLDDRFVAEFETGSKSVAGELHEIELSPEIVSEFFSEPEHRLKFSVNNLQSAGISIFSKSLSPEFDNLAVDIVVDLFKDKPCGVSSSIMRFFKKTSRDFYQQVGNILKNKL